MARGDAAPPPNVENNWAQSPLPPPLNNPYAYLFLMTPVIIKSLKASEAKILISIFNQFSQRVVWLSVQGKKITKKI